MKKLLALVCAFLILLLCGCESKDKTASSQLSDKEIKAAIIKDYDYYMDAQGLKASYEEDYKITAKSGDVTTSSTFNTYYSVERNKEGDIIVLTNETSTKVGTETVSSYITYIDGKYYTDSSNGRKITGEMTPIEFYKVLMDTTDTIDISFETFEKHSIDRNEKGATLKLSEPNDICNYEALVLLEDLAMQIGYTAKEVKSLSVKADFNSKNEVKNIALEINGVDNDGVELKLEVNYSKFSKKVNVSAPKKAESFEKMSNAGYYSVIENAFLSYLAADSQKLKIGHQLWLTDYADAVSINATYNMDYSITEEKGLTFKYKRNIMNSTTDYVYEDGYIKKYDNFESWPTPFATEPLAADEAAAFLASLLATPYIDMNYVTDFTIKSENQKNIVSFTTTDDYVKAMVILLAAFYNINYTDMDISTCSIEATFDNHYNLTNVHYNIKGPNTSASITLIK